jgi:potassium-dependent mechanosensitive channel
MVVVAVAGAFIAGIAGAPPPADAQSPIQKALTGATGDETAAPPGKSPAESARDAQTAASADIEALERKRREVAAELAELEAAAAAAGDPDGRTATVRTQVTHLHRLERLYARQIDSIRRAAVLRAALEEVERTIAADPQLAIGSDPPYTLARLDRLLDAEDAERPRRSEPRAAVADAVQAVEAARAQFAAREAERRAAKEALDAETVPAAIAAAQVELRLAELASAIARERVAAEQAALSAARTDVELQTRSEVALAAQIAFVEQHLELAPEELAEELAAIERREFAVRDREADAKRAIASAERRLAAVQKRLDAEPEPGPALAAELEARRLGLLAAQRHAESLEEELDRLAELRRLRQARVRVLAGAIPRDEMRALQAELAGADADRERDRRLAETRRADIERLRALVQPRIAAPHAEGTGLPAGVEPWLREQERLAAVAIARIDEQLEGLAEHERAAAHLAHALGGRKERASVSDRIGDLAEALSGVWRRELFAFDDYPITIGKLAGALLVFLLGIVLSRWFARVLAALIRRRSALDEGALSAIQSLVFYFLIALFFLIALRSVNIPLTVFTVAGGALAIGIGFGSQTIINNFVSGLILMVERPIKVGDLVVLDGASGRVERIGPRSTRIRTFDNVHLIVPNSKLLENNVINWTLSDDVIRTRITVGVAYGSPTREVERLLREQIDAQPDILAHPPPVVLFEDFAADALLFQADFWIKLSPLVDQRVVRSNLRHGLDQSFREHGISIAFPQRDVHLDAARPIPVRVVRETGRDEGGGA